MTDIRQVEEDLERIRELLWMLLRVQTAMAREMAASPWAEAKHDELAAVVKAAEDVISR